MGAEFHVKPPPALAHLANDLAALDAAGLLRRRPSVVGTDVVSFASNDYLGLAERACHGRAGAGASRLVAGEREEHVALEQMVARWLGAGAALVFSSGYAANVGVLSSLVRRDDLLISDAYNHASLVDGARLSRARVAVVPHLALEEVERALRANRSRRAWVVTESYFSMDADAPDLAAYRRLCDAWGAGLIVDEAHALGVLGPSGRGLAAEAGVIPDVLIGTFGKAFGAGGAFVAGCSELVAWLWNRARTFVYSTGLSPAVAGAALAGLQWAFEHPELREQALANAAELRSGMRRQGLRPAGFGHIIPWVIGAPGDACRASEVLRGAGIHAPPIRPPSVPEGTARIRFTATAAHRKRDIEHLLDTLANFASPTARKSAGVTTLAP